MLNKLMGVNYQVTKTKSVELLYRLLKNINRSIYDMNDVNMPDKDKLYNQLNTISTWDLIVFIYIKVLYKFTYKCQYYCMSDEAKIARNAYLRSARQYNSVMNSKKLFTMDEVTLDALITKLKVTCWGSEIFFDNNEPYVIYDKVRYNLWDQIPLLNIDGSHKTLADVTITVCKYEDNRLDGKLINCGPDMSIVQDKLHDIENIGSLGSPITNTLIDYPRYEGWKQFV